MDISDAKNQFMELIERVHTEGISIDLEQDGKVIARLVPVSRPDTLKVRDLNDFIKNLPPLGDDAEQFSEDIRRIRKGL